MYRFYLRCRLACAFRRSMHVAKHARQHQHKVDVAYSQFKQEKLYIIDTAAFLAQANAVQALITRQHRLNRRLETQLNRLDYWQEKYKGATT